MESFDILVIGGGQAAARAAQGAREAAAEARIALVGEEHHLPYERPPLSKSALLSAPETAETDVHPAEWYATNRIATRLGVRVVKVDPDRRTVTLHDGTCLGWRKLVFATGSRPRRIDLELDPARVHVLRTREDAERLRRRLLPGRRVGVVGAGFIGLEVAAAARERGCEVDIFEAAGHAMARVIPDFVARVVERRHREAGTRFHFGHPADASALSGFDDVVVGIGILPNDDLARDCGVACHDGIVVDAYGQTNIPSVFAAGEVTSHPSWRGGDHARRESWQIAEHQAIAAGRSAGGQMTAFCEIPWFWSDQFELNIQVLGDVPSDAEWIVRGHLESRAFSAFALRAERIEGVVAVNSGRDIAATRRLMRRGLMPSRDLLSDDAKSWNDILKTASVA